MFLKSTMRDRGSTICLGWCFLLIFSSPFVFGGYFFFNVSIYSFIPDCVGSSLPHEFFPNCSPWASHCRAFSCWGARALGHAAAVFAARGFRSWGSWAQSTGSVAGVLRLSCSAAREILSDQGSNPRLPHLQANSPLLSHQGNPGTDTQTGSPFLFTNNAAPRSFARLSPPGHVDGVGRPFTQHLPWLKCSQSSWLHILAYKVVLFQDCFTGSP